MNTKIALSAMSILSAMALMGGATYAFFSDAATSQNNTFATGTVDLQIATDPDGLVGGTAGTYGNDIPAPAINEVNIVPNFSKTYYFWLKNNSSAAVPLTLDGTFDDVVTAGNADIANQLSVNVNCGTASTVHTVNAWDTNIYPIGSLAAGAEVQCSMDVTLADVGNTYQGSSVRFDGVFTGTQN